MLPPRYLSIIFYNEPLKKGVMRREISSETWKNVFLRGGFFTAGLGRMPFRN